MEETYKVNVDGKAVEITFTDNQIIVKSRDFSFDIPRAPGKKECQIGCIISFFENLNSCRKLGLLAPVCIAAEFFSLLLCLARCVL